MRKIFIQFAMIYVKYNEMTYKICEREIKTQCFTCSTVTEAIRTLPKTKHWWIICIKYIRTVNTTPSALY